MVKRGNALEKVIPILQKIYQRTFSMTSRNVLKIVTNKSDAKYQ